jgi:hypothetical protein
MEQIVKSLKPMALAVAAAVVFVLGTAFLIASDATLTPSSLGASSDLAQAARWLQFLGAACALAAVCTVGWDLILRSEWASGLEIAAAALGTLLITVGLLAAAASNGSSPAAPVTGAVGIGIWALLVLSRAARTSLREKGTATADRPLESQLWLATAVGLFVLAIGYGLTAAANSRGPAVVAGLLEAIGVAVLAGSAAAARSRGLLRGRSVPAVLAGLLLLAVSFLAAAIVAGLAPATLSAEGAGLGIAAAIELAAFVVLGLAAWTRLRELYRLPALPVTGFPGCPGGRDSPPVLLRPATRCQGALPRPGRSSGRCPKRLGRAPGREAPATRGRHQQPQQAPHPRMTPAFTPSRHPETRFRL